VQTEDFTGDRLSRDEVRALAASFLPATADGDGLRASLTLEDVLVDKKEMKFVLRLIVFDLEGEKATVRDIKEQEVYFGETPFREHRARFAAFLDGWTRALRAFFAATGTVETLMPHDLSFPGTLELRKAETAEDFEAAHLVKSRLGRWMA
jgi:hypothetical protein